MLLDLAAVSKHFLGVVLLSRRAAGGALPLLLLLLLLPLGLEEDVGGIALSGLP